MSDHGDVRIPLGNENAGSRRINGMVLAVVGAAVAALAAAMWIVPRANHAQQVAIARHQVTVLDEDGRVVAVRSGYATGRPQVMVQTDGTMIRASTAEQYRLATGQNIDFLDIVRAADGSPYIGKVLRLDDVNVPLVAGDQVFTVGPSPTDSILVKIRSPRIRAANGENELVVNEGDRVMVVGRLLPYPDKEKERRFGLSTTEQSQIGNKTLYIEGRLVEEVASNGPNIPKQ